MTESVLTQEIIEGLSNRFVGAYEKTCVDWEVERNEATAWAMFSQMMQLTLEKVLRAYVLATLADGNLPPADSLDQMETDIRVSALQDIREHIWPDLLVKLGLNGSAPSESSSAPSDSNQAEPIFLGPPIDDEHSMRAEVTETWDTGRGE